MSDKTARTFFGALLWQNKSDVVLLCHCLQLKRLARAILLLSIENEMRQAERRLWEANTHIHKHTHTHSYVFDPEGGWFSLHTIMNPSWNIVVEKQGGWEERGMEVGRLSWICNIRLPCYPIFYSGWLLKYSFSPTHHFILTLLSFDVIWLFKLDSGSSSPPARTSLWVSLVSERRHSLLFWCSLSLVVSPSRPLCLALSAVFFLFVFHSVSQIASFLCLLHWVFSRMIPMLQTVFWTFSRIVLNVSCLLKEKYGFDVCDNPQCRAGWQVGGREECPWTLFVVLMHFPLGSIL